MIGGILDDVSWIAWSDQTSKTGHKLSSRTSYKSKSWQNASCEWNEIQYDTLYSNLIHSLQKKSERTENR